MTTKLSGSLKPLLRRINRIFREWFLLNLDSNRCPDTRSVQCNSTPSFTDQAKDQGRVGALGVALVNECERVRNDLKGKNVVDRFKRVNVVHCVQSEEGERKHLHGVACTAQR